MKNVNIWASSAVILAGLSLTSCSVDSMVMPADSTEIAVFYGKTNITLEEYLDKNGLVDKKYIGYEPLYYYEVLVSNPVIKEGKLSFEDSWKKVDSLEGHMGIARRVDVFYKLVSVKFVDNKYVVSEKVTNDYMEITDDYKYMYADDYVVREASEPFYINNGKILKKVR